VHRHDEQRILPYTAAQLYDLVVDVEHYPEFLPWCIAARVTRHEEGVTYADLVIGFRMIRERFGSRVAGTSPTTIDVTPTSGPFRALTNSWRFTDQADGGCLVDFHVEFEFRSRVLNALIGALFHEAVRRMVSAFEERARVLYGEAAEANMAKACSTVDSRTA
jgi:coenzyme Q-binding protein COQ10